MCSALVHAELLLLLIFVLSLSLRRKNLIVKIIIEFGIKHSAVINYPFISCVLSVIYGGL